MMNCRTYIFKLTSGQLADAGRMEKLQAFQHRLICARCRAFTRNDAQLSAALAEYRAHLQSLPNDTPDAG